ncbi:MAG: hypothetical protein H7645_03000 [Candidatus Heimdallarchaeota archaeon]|nr:hypothetical protein [Candidatus Heimdallarchaeota archaeon]MCK4769284.1 hypothetical protein [Candidatus Heimdallarchaeota archaeon]
MEVEVDMLHILFGILLIIHGLVFFMFLIYVKLPEEEGYFGWSRQSWLLDRYLEDKIVKIVGIVLWILVMVGFVVSGIVILSKNESWRLIDIIASFISLFAFTLFWNELKPKPKYFILGPIIAIINIITLLIDKWPTDIIIFG